MKIQLSTLFLMCLLLQTATSCTGKLDAGDINLENWKNDRNGCKGLRLQDVKELRNIKNSFLGSYNQEIIQTFGRPDRVELIDKSQSFFIYFLEPSDRCQQYNKKEPLKVLFRMNAINKVSEITVTELNP